MSEEKVKILFRFYSNLFEEDTSEKLPALIVDKEKGLYLIQTVPLFAPMIAFEDLVSAKYDEKEKGLIYKETVDYSGHSVIQIVIVGDSVKTKDIEKIFIDLKCQSEGTLEGYFSIGIPYDLNYKAIKEKLEKLEEEEMISYAEPCLSEKHNSDLNKT